MRSLADARHPVKVHDSSMQASAGFIQRKRLLLLIFLHAWCALNKASLQGAESKQERETGEEGTVNGPAR